MSFNSFLIVITLLVYIGLEKESHFVLTLSQELPDADENAAKKDTGNISSTVKPEAHLKRQGVLKDKDLNNLDSIKVTSNSSINVTPQNPNSTMVSISSTTDSVNRTIDTPKWLLNIKSGALERTGFVALGLMTVVLFFFLAHAIRLRQKRSKSRKYGIIASTASDVEMEPLEKGSVEDDEEETTLFDAQHKFRIK